MEPTGDTSTATMDSAVDRISSAIFGEDSLTEPAETPGLETAPSEPPTAEAAPAPDAAAPKTYEVPKSWKKEMHQHWGTLPPDAQAYVIEREQQLLNGFQQFRPISDALSPHLEYLNKQNIQAPYAIDSLLRAHRALTEGPIEQRRAYYEQLGRNLKIIQEQAQAQQTQQPVDPTVQALQQKLTALESAMLERQYREVEAVKSEVQKEVDTFAADTKAHPYFEEVSQDIAAFVSLGLSLQDAYDKAVWANPVTRAKEQARVLTEHDAKLKENARLNALPKKKAAGVNLKSDGDGKAPTEPLGSLEDTIRSVHRELRQRVS